jgi:hypothetical protein
MGRAAISALNEATVGPDEIRTNQHVVQFYADDEELMDRLTPFIGEGLNEGESAIVIATPEHLRALRQRLVAADVNLMKAMFEDRYIALDASVGLTSFMVGDRPDEQLFAEFIKGLVSRASAHNRKVRGFGEMVALLWARGQAEATVRLEQMWCGFCQKHSLSILCAYPKAGFEADPTGSLPAICATHSKIL